MELRNFFKKNNSKNSAQNEQAFYQKNTRKKFLKIFAATSLALITCVTTLLATAPFGTGAVSAATETNQNNTTQTSRSNGLITPKEDDPVLLKTESGIEIKWGNATLSSGNLSGFSYFTTIGTGGVYTWVIIGYNGLTQDSYSHQYEFSGKFSYWVEAYEDATITFSDIFPNMAPFFQNQYEINSSAGNALASEQEKQLVSNMDVFKISYINAKSNSEIPSGCVLCLANDIVATTYCGGTSAGGSGDSAGGDLTTRDVCSLETLGLIDFNIQPVTVQKRAWDGSVSTQKDLKLFSLGGVQNSFKYTNYLTTTQAKLSTGYWTGDGYSAWKNGVINTSGDYLSTQGTFGIRPAFCLKVV